MPPTYSPWLKVFEALGRFGFARKGGPFDGVMIGDPQQLYDCEGDVAWRRYVHSKPLYDAWSAPPASPWSGFTKPTLFAAFDDFRPHPLSSYPLGGHPSADSIGPFAVPGLDPKQPPRPPAEPRTAILLDLPAAYSVAHAAWLARYGGHQPVVLFNNWPHSRGIVEMSDAMGALLYFAPWTDFERNQRPATSPPVFVLDRNRLGGHQPRPRDFDNRYFHLDSDFPSVATLRKNGIDRILYVMPGAQPMPAQPAGWIPVSDASEERERQAAMEDPQFRTFMRDNEEIFGAKPDTTPANEMDDINPYLVQVAKSMPVGIATANQNGWGWGTPKPYSPTPRATPFNTTKDPKFLGYRRSAAGGFGKLVPEPSSGGG